MVDASSVQSHTEIVRRWTDQTMANKQTQDQYSPIRNHQTNLSDNGRCKLNTDPPETVRRLTDQTMVARRWIDQTMVVRRRTYQTMADASSTQTHLKP